MSSSFFQKPFYKGRTDAENWGYQKDHHSQNEKHFYVAPLPRNINHCRAFRRCIADGNYRIQLSSILKMQIQICIPCVASVTQTRILLNYFYLFTYFCYWPSTLTWWKNWKRFSKLRLLKMESSADGRKRRFANVLISCTELRPAIVSTLTYLYLHP